MWSIDSDFDCRGVAAGEVYSITDHCGQITLLNGSIDPHYLARQVLQVGRDQGFTRDYRPSLGIMRDLTIDLPADATGDFDTALMQEWTLFQEELERQEGEIASVIGVSG